MIPNTSTCLRHTGIFDVWTKCYLQSISCDAASMRTTQLFRIATGVWKLYHNTWNMYALKKNRKSSIHEANENQNENWEKTN